MGFQAENTCALQFRAVALGGSEHGEGHRHRVDGTFGGDMERQRRRFAQGRFQPGDFGSIHLSDSVTPAAMLGGIGGKAFGRQIPQQAAAPLRLHGGEFGAKAPPFRHRALAQAEIGLRIAPTRIDPGPGGARGDAAGLATLDHDDARPGFGEMIGDRGTDDAGANDDDCGVVGHDGVR
jgi:hypothetical protein